MLPATRSGSVRLTEIAIMPLGIARRAEAAATVLPNWLVDDLLPGEDRHGGDLALQRVVVGLVARVRVERRSAGTGCSEILPAARAAS